VAEARPFIPEPLSSPHRLEHHRRMERKAAAVIANGGRWVAAFISKPGA
jgi:hypothetical protein